MKISSTTALLFLSVSAASALPGSYNKPTSTADWGYGKYEATTTADSYNAVKTHHVTVGGKESYSGLPILRYNPEVVFADPGDVVLFDFLANNHTVTESTFDSPCQKKSFGDVFASGFRPNFVCSD